MDYLSLIKQPIEEDLNKFVALFNESLTHADGLLSQVLLHIRQRGGKRMRPMLIMLMARNFGEVSDITQHAAVGLELLHTASLIHDDVVDESGERRGQASVNAALLHVSFTGNQQIIQNLSELGRTLAAGEILQLTNIQNEQFSEEVYYQVIRQKTAALFESCAAIGALSVNASDEDVKRAGQFGQNLGIMFQIRDDIFDYFDSKEIGKPTSNDMIEGKLTLPVIYALNKTNSESMQMLAKKVKAGTINSDEIATLVEFTKQQGGIDYAEQRMQDFHRVCMEYINQNVKEKAIREALIAYIDYVVQRSY